jgi:hypothetical protein
MLVFLGNKRDQEAISSLYLVFYDDSILIASLGRQFPELLFIWLNQCYAFAFPESEYFLAPFYRRLPSFVYKMKPLTGVVLHFLLHLDVIKIHFVDFERFLCGLNLIT